MCTGVPFELLQQPAVLELQQHTARSKLALLYFACFSPCRHWHVLQEFVQKLNLLVVTYDAHGHGKSEPLNLEDRCTMAC